MSTIFGNFGLGEIDKTIDIVGQSVVYDEVTAYLMRHNTDMQAASAFFVETETTDYKRVYKLTGNGMLQSNSRMGRPAAVKVTGQWDVSFDLLSGADQFLTDRVTMAYMTLAELERQVKNILIRDINWSRFNVLRHLLNPTNETFVDERWGSLTIRRLANSDSGTLYPAIIGTDVEANENHYLASGYIASAISNINNPFPVLQEELEEHVGKGTPVALINQAQRPLVEALTNFISRAEMNVAYADNVTLAGAPIGVNVPGTFLGKVDEVYVYEWRWMPAGYIFCLDADQPAPLSRRVDIPESLRGFQLVAENDKYPFKEAYWEHREGYGVGNRLNGVAMQLVVGSYAAPTAYA